MYFQSVVENLPGGITIIIRYESDNSLIPEYISEGFASMCHMTVEEVENVYKNDIFASFHSDDSDNIKNKVLDSINSGNSHCELTGRLKLKRRRLYLGKEHYFINTFFGWSQKIIYGSY